MRRFFEELKDFRHKGDMFLLLLCLIVAGFGLVCIASATSADKFGSNVRYIAFQILAIALGVMIYAIPKCHGRLQCDSASDADSFRHR